MEVRLVSLATKLLGPFGIPLQILVGDGGSRALDGLDEVLEVDEGFEELLGFYVVPGHFFRPRVSRGARGDFYYAVYLYLVQFFTLVFACYGNSRDCRRIKQTHLFEMCGLLNFPDGLHQGILHGNSDITARVAVSKLG